MVTTSLAPPAPALTAFEPFRALLWTERADCAHRRELGLAETATSVPDPVAVSRAALSRRIEEIDAALDRIATGSCVHCGAAIPVERLEFRLFAAGCVSCEEMS